MRLGPGLLPVGRYTRRCGGLRLWCDVGVAFGGCQREDAVALAERFDCLCFGSWFDVHGRVERCEGGCDLGVVGFLVGFARW